MAIIDEGRQKFIIDIKLRIVNLRYGGRQCHQGARLSDVELRGMPLGGG